MERIFTENLKKQLHARIKGDLFVHIVNDRLVVDIQSAGLSVWRYTLYNIRVNIVMVYLAQMLQMLSSKSTRTTF